MAENGIEPSTGLTHPENRSWSPVGLLVAAKNYGEALDTLRQWDHTGRPEYRIPGDPDFAVESLTYLRDFMTETRDLIAGSGKDPAPLIAEIDAVLAGYRYRRDHRLPNLRIQVETVRSRLYANDIDAAGQALGLLDSQPDARDDVIQLKREYQPIRELGENGFSANADQVWSDIFGITAGLDFMTVSECTDLLRRLNRLEQNLAALNTLAELQHKARRLQEAADHIPEARKWIVERVNAYLDLRTFDIKLHFLSDPFEPLNPDGLSGRDLLEYRLGKIIETAGLPAALLPVVSDQGKLAEFAETHAGIRDSIRQALRESEQSRTNRVSKLLRRRPDRRTRVLTTLAEELEKTDTGLQKLARMYPEILETYEFIRVWEESVQTAPDTSRNGFLGESK